MGIRISGVGSFVPKKTLTNNDITKMRPRNIPAEDWTDDAWIFQRTGIKERRIALGDWGSSDLMMAAAQAALRDAHLSTDNIDLLITSTSFADKGANVPRCSEIIKAKLGFPQTTLSLEENAECAGFVWALVRAKTEMEAFDFSNVLVVSGDKTTAFTNYRDRKTCPLFGDAAGAVVLSQTNGFADLGPIYRATNTEFIGCMDIPAGGSQMPASYRTVREKLHYMRMPGGKEMLEYIGGKAGPEACRVVCHKANIPLGLVSHIIPHQANIRISNMIEKKLQLQPGVMFKENQALYGNTSGSSVPLALDTLYRQGRLCPNSFIILLAFGAGFTLGAVLIRWTKPKFTG